MNAAITSNSGVKKEERNRYLLYMSWKATSSCCAEASICSRVMYCSFDILIETVDLFEEIQFPLFSLPFQPECASALTRRRAGGSGWLWSCRGRWPAKTPSAAVGALSSTGTISYCGASQLADSPSVRIEKESEMKRVHTFEHQLESNDLDKGQAKNQAGLP
jgi:hypothetical protein